MSQQGLLHFEAKKTQKEGGDGTTMAICVLWRTGDIGDLDQQNKANHLHMHEVRAMASRGAGNSQSKEEADDIASHHSEPKR